MSSSEAEAEGLTLLVADNTTGYFGVNLAKPGQPKPYQARVVRGGKKVHLGSFATAEEAALCIARSSEGKAAAKRAAAAGPLTSEEARQQAEAEGLTLLKADNKAGYYSVHLAYPGRPKLYQVRVSRGGHLGMFATAEEAALCVARSPEGQAAAKKAAGALPLTSEEVGRRGARSLKHKELPGCREHMLTAVGARSVEEEEEAAAAEEAVEEEAEMELIEVVEVVGAEEAEEADVVVLDAEVVEAEEAKEEAEAAQMAVEVAGVMEV